MSKRIARWITLWLMLISMPSFAQSTMQLINGQDTHRLAAHLRIYKETGQPLSISDVLQRKDEFQFPVGDNPNYGLSDKGIWLTMTFSNVTDVNNWVVDVGFTQLDKVDMYLVAENDVIARVQQGKLRQNQPFRFPTLETPLPFATTMELFIRIENQSGNLIAPVDIQSTSRHIQNTIFDSLLWGLFYGGLLILAIYNFVLYLGNREASLLAYVGYISTVIFWQFVWGGHLGLIFPGSFSLWMSQHLDIIFVVIGIGSGIFTITFLDAREKAPKLTPFMGFNMAMLVLLGAFSVFDVLPALWQNTLVYGASLLAIISYLIAGFESYFNHFKPARYFIFAWSILASSALIGMLSLVGVFPSNFFTTYCFQFGVFLEAGLFSLALMDKSKSRLQHEIQQATLDLRNNMEFIEEQNARLDIARKDAVKASHVKSQFLANMSHEIRTPLNAILGFSKELNELSLPPDKQEQVRVINAAADNLLSIVNDVLDVSKIEAGKLQINNQPFSLGQLLEEIVSVMAKSAHQRHLEFIFDAEPLPEKLIGDVVRIRQILNNLLSNALKFTPNGHIRLSASGHTLDHGIYEICLTVEDTGIGISQQDRKKLFSAFSQVDDALNRNYQGTGLGLMICQQLVKLMRGTISLTSEPGQGSCFTVTLRMNLLNANKTLAAHTDWQGKNVLLADEYPASLEASRKLLVALGAKVTTTTTLADVQGQKWDVAFLTLTEVNQGQRSQRFGSFAQLEADKRFVLYSGTPPGSSDLTSDASMRLPLTPNKLNNLLHVEKTDRENAMKSRLTSLPKARVLAVDDMEMNLLLLRTWLKDTPLDMTFAHSGAEAVQLCEAQEFELILMDVQMPNMDGLQASKLIRQTQLNLGTPIIAVTAHAFREEQERLLASGMDDYLPKPIELPDLISLINRWCEEQEHVPVSLPSLDWELALKKANHNVEGAREMLTEFAANIPTALGDIEEASKLRHMQDLQHHIHRLHGASCYTGVPRLQGLCDEIEGYLKQAKHQQALERLPSLVTEAELVRSESEKLLSDLAAAPSPGFGNA